MAELTTTSKKTLRPNSKYGITEVFVKHDYFAKLRVKLLKDNEDGTFTLLKDQGDYLEEVETITTTNKIYDAPEGFLSIELDYTLKYIYEEGEHAIPRYKYIMHSGSSRSSKSWSIEEWCARECETTENLRINVWRDTRESLKGSVWDDFKKLFPLSGRSYRFPRNTVPIYFTKTNSTIEPHGADITNAHGVTQDIAWLNEPYLIPKETFDQIDQRANQIIIDLNPKQGHWSDTLARHPRCKVIHSTFMLNPFCPPEQKRKILGYDPSNPINVKNGTANEYLWQVYGLGLKAEKPNKIYHKWKKITLAEYIALPYDEYYGLDFGLANPTALVSVKYNDHTFYFQELLYKPEKEMTEGLIPELERIGIDKNAQMVCDSANPEKIIELRNAGFNAIPAFKGAGSVFSGISLIQRANVCFTDKSTNLEAEYDQYEWDTDRMGILDKPIKFMDHILDAARYCCSYLAIKLRISI